MEDKEIIEDATIELDEEGRRELNLECIHFRPEFKYSQILYPFPRMKPTHKSTELSIELCNRDMIITKYFNRGMTEEQSINYIKMIEQFLKA